MNAFPESGTRFQGGQMTCWEDPGRASRVLGHRINPDDLLTGECFCHGNLTVRTHGARKLGYECQEEVGQIPHQTSEVARAKKKRQPFRAAAASDLRRSSGSGYAR